VCVLTGAGVSAESGVPTFRDAQTGLWARFRPEDLATPAAFKADPRRTWDWYEWRRQVVGRAEPNAGHFALVELARRVPRLTLVTQNVDGLHQRAGSKDVIEYHGNLFRDRCSMEDEIATRAAVSRTGIPECARCGAMLRPDVVWFGESIPRAALQSADAAARSCDVFVSVGTSSAVYPAAALAQAALARGAPVIEVNPNATELSDAVTVVLRERSGLVLPALLRLLD
jgi:NAD-dependent deacetylase